ncbi:MAG TPA: hypothetical protein VMW52_12570 [Phycisphaerae bacterium]|nr:hypothetical protein [Phycisphaerae bacterium]
MSERRRQSKAFQSLGDTRFAEYRALCLPREAGGKGATYSAIIKWLGRHGVKSSLSMVQRDAEHFRAVAERLQRMTLAGQSARQIVSELESSGGVANMQAATVQVFTNQVLDFLLADGSGINADNVAAMSKLGATLARLTGSEISRYRAEVERKAAQAAAKARELAASGPKADVRTQLKDLADQILGVAK